METYKQELNSFLKNKAYVGCLILISIISYGYAAVNTTVGIDDTRGDFYVGSGNIMIASGRFGMTLWSKIFGYCDKLIYHSFAIDLISVFLFLWAAVNFCILFRRITKNKISMLSCTIFSGILISYPLMNEIWEYTAANLCVCMGYLCVSAVLPLIWEQLHDKWSKSKIALCLILLTLVSATYESLLIVYIFMVFAILALQNLYLKGREQQLGVMMRQGILYAAFLARSCVLRVVIASIPLDSPQWELYAKIYSAVKGKNFTEVYYNYNRKLPDVNIQSVLTWASTMANNAYYDLFWYYGLDYIESEEEMYTKASRYAEEHNLPSYPRQGYIVDTGDYILVNF